jgi:hypothetical protein
VQAWRDIGRLIELRDSGVELHEHRPWDFTNLGPCHCFPCRVRAAWHWWLPQQKPKATPPSLRRDRR